MARSIMFENFYEFVESLEYAEYLGAEWRANPFQSDDSKSKLFFLWIDKFDIKQSVEMKKFCDGMESAFYTKGGD